jgi:UDP-2,3-diacylglucosamine pyrophosphatase LpxH
MYSKGNTNANLTELQPDPGRASGNHIHLTPKTDDIFLGELRSASSKHRKAYGMGPVADIWEGQDFQFLEL